jgi:hypothetical protein
VKPQGRSRPLASRPHCQVLPPQSNSLACFPPYSTRRYSKILLLRKDLSEFRLTALERMAGTTRLEPRGLCRDRKKVRIGNGLVGSDSPRLASITGKPEGIPRVALRVDDHSADGLEREFKDETKLRVGIWDARVSVRQPNTIHQQTHHSHRDEGDHKIPSGKRRNCLGRPGS